MRIKDAFGLLMEEVQSAYSGSESPYYKYGRPMKIANLLSEQTKNKTWKYKKYPLVMLLQEFTELRGGSQFESVATVTVVIVTQADTKNRTQNRDDANYTNILYPVYNTLIEKLKESDLFSTSSGTDHNVTESPYWGSEGSYGNTGNLMNDTLDALFIENLELRLNFTC